MTVVIESQVETIAVEIREQFFVDPGIFEIDIEDIVRSVIAQYDISNIEQDYIHDDVIPSPQI